MVNISKCYSSDQCYSTALYALLWQRQAITNHFFFNCTTKTIIDRLLYQLHVQRQALIASFISFMFKGDHCSLLLSAMCLMAITDCLCYQFYDWRRSMIAFLSTMWLKAINNYMYGGETLIASFMSAMFGGDHWQLLWWMIPYKRAKRSLSTFFWVDMVENEWVSPQSQYQQ